MVQVSCAFFISLVLLMGTPVFGGDSSADPQRASSSAQTSRTHDEALKEWNYLKEQSKDTRKELLLSNFFQINLFLQNNADWDFSDAVQLLKADLRARKGDYKFAIVDYLKLVYEYPNSRLIDTAKSSLSGLIEKKIDKKHRSLLYAIAKGSAANTKRDRLAQLLKNLTEQAGDVFYEPLLDEYSAFFSRFPGYAGTDELTLLLGDLEARNENYYAALTFYQKVLALYPDSQLRPRAQRSIGDVYADDLKDKNSAIKAYKEVTDRYPNSAEVGYAYAYTAKLEEEMKHYNLSVEVYDKIVKLYPGKEIAQRALNNEARILQDRMDKPDDAINAYKRIADMFKGTDEAAAALKEAADIARKQKEYDVEVAMCLRFVNDCPMNEDAPEMYYLAAQVTEEKLQDTDKAIDLYYQAGEKYPDSKFGQKAKTRRTELRIRALER